MKIVCVGGGPAGLYFGILSKLRDPDSDVLVVEKNPRGAVTAWGTVFWYDLLLGLLRTDRAIAVRIREAANQWDAQRVRADGKGAAQLGGHGFSIGRALTLEILTERALSLGARIDCEPARLPDAELAVASDGAASRVRAPSWLANCGRTWGPPGSSTRSPFHSPDLRRLAMVSRLPIRPRHRAHAWWSARRKRGMAWESASALPTSSRTPWPTSRRRPRRAAAAGQPGRRAA